MTDPVAERIAKEAEAVIARYVQHQQVRHPGKRPVINTTDAGYKILVQEITTAVAQAQREVWEGALEIHVSQCEYCDFRADRYCSEGEKYHRRSRAHDAE